MSLQNAIRKSPLGGDGLDAQYATSASEQSKSDARVVGSLPRKGKARRRALTAAAVIGVVLIGGIAATGVDDTVTPADRAAFAAFSQRCNLPATPTDTLATLHNIQACVLAQIPQAVIPHRMPREPLDVLAAGHGECYDRARIMEKWFNSLGFSTRHVSLYERKPLGWAGLFFKRTRSHAVFDVRIAGGWMSMGTNGPFMGVTTTGKILPTEGVNDSPPPAWKYGQPAELPSEENLIVYGLRSRHGQFYGPYLPVPDISWRDVKYNFLPAR